MPTSFGSYDANQDGSISQDEWMQFYPLDAGPASAGPYHIAESYPGSFPQLPSGAPSQPTSGPYDESIQQALDFFGQLTAAFGNSGFEFTPELLQSFGTIIPAMGLYNQFSEAQYQTDALDFMREELGIKGKELDLAMEQLQFEQGPAWDWYKNVFFPETMKNQALEFDTQRYLMQGQRDVADAETAQALERTLQAREGTAQAKESTRQSQIASQIARYNALQQIGLGRTTRTADGRQVRGSGYTYGYV